MPGSTTYKGLPYPLGNETADVAGDMQELAEAVDTAMNAHETDDMPHQFTDSGTTYNWGLKVVDGVLIFVYEEVGS